MIFLVATFLLACCMLYALCTSVIGYTDEKTMEEAT